MTVFRLSRIPLKNFVKIGSRLRVDHSLQKLFTDGQMNGQPEIKSESDSKPPGRIISVKAQRCKAWDKQIYKIYIKDMS